MAGSDLTAARLRELLTYHPETGVFTRNSTRRRWLAGEEVGSSSKLHAYYRLKVDGGYYPAHRLAWLYMTGEWPSEFIDHIDRNRRNNVWKNLRDVTQTVNQYNVVAPQRNNKLGVRGVCSTKWGFQASIRVDGRLRYLGHFKTLEEAAQAYLNAKQKVCPQALLAN
jgi:hypothetical protein